MIDINQSLSKTKEAWVVSMHMGLGHLRAAYNLRDLSGGTIFVDGDKEFCTKQEYRYWERVRRAYYWISKSEYIPIFGKISHKILYKIQEIPPYYPFRDLSYPDIATTYLDYSIRHKGICSTIVQKVRENPLPVINTFYASAIAIDLAEDILCDNYLVICDSDFHRIWVAKDPKKSRIKYFASGMNVKKRLMAYGVPEENIFLTGFPLPKENIGSREKLEIVREDLLKRLVRLDPNHKFFDFHENSVRHFLGDETAVLPQPDYLKILFSFGGAGAQTSLAKKILKGLVPNIKNNQVKIIFGVGIQKSLLDELMDYINELKLNDLIGDSINILYDPDINSYFKEFNKALRDIDILWTKPSEISFYCALGLPILLAPSIGTHEEQNSRWLQDIHTGVKPAGAEEFAYEWIFDLRNNGVLAEAAWDGFLKGRKLGVYKIEDVLRKGSFNPGKKPLER